ncbi:MAG: ankyrin repeat domain-containing protein [Planctomycetota bacterium]
MAVRRGDFTSFEMLLDAGARFDPASADARMIRHAIRSSRIDVVDRILTLPGVDFSVMPVGPTLHMAAYKGEVEVLDRLLTERARFKPLDNSERSVLTSAVSGRSFECVELLLKHGADPNEGSSEGRSALEKAVSDSTPEIVRAFLRHGVDINHIDKNGLTLLMRAITRVWQNQNYVFWQRQLGTTVHVERAQQQVQDGKAIARLLVERGADLEATSPRGTTALAMVARTDDVALLQMIVDRGADVTTTNVAGMSLIHHAMYARDLEVIRYIESLGFSALQTSDTGLTPLHCAVDASFLEGIKYCTRRGASLEAGTTEELKLDQVGKVPAGTRPLHIAARRYQRSIILELIAQGANLEGAAGDGQTRLIMAVRQGHVDPVRVFLESGADPDAADDLGRTPLMHAVLNRHNAAFDLLWAYVTDINQADRDGMTALHHAMSRGFTGQQRAIELIGRGVSRSPVNAEGRTPLMCYQGKRITSDRTLIDLLIEGTDDINATDHEGWTTLMHMIEHGSPYAVQALVERGADRSVIANDGTTLSTLLEERMACRRCRPLSADIIALLRQP